jgi:phospholipid/cholesterol/gamma-HCH transport system substrate-binding protein
VKNTNLNYLIVGGFVLLVLAGGLAAVALLTGRTGATDSYHAIYRNVSGIEFGTRVLFEGFPIGQVETVSPVDEKGKIRFRVDMGVTSGWKIPIDSRAEIASSGLLAAVTINLKAGQDNVLLKPGDKIPSKESGNVLKAVSDLAEDISRMAETDIKPLIANISKTVGGFGKLVDAEGAELIGDVQKMMGRINTQMPEIMNNINEFSIKLNDSAGRLSNVLNQKNIKAIDSILADMKESSNNMTKLTKEFAATRTSIDKFLVTVNTVISDNRLDVDRSVIDMRHSVEAVARHIDAINQNLEGASRNMYEFSRQIRQNPGLLLGGTPPTDNAPKN